MSGDTVALTKEGVKLSYGRFLSDSAGGYVLLIVSAHFLAFTLPVPPALANTASEAKSAAIVLAGVFILLLGPPFGLALNSLSWFSLGAIQVWFVNAWAAFGWFNRVMNFFTYHTGQEYNVVLLQRSFAFLDPAKRRLTAKPRQSLYSQTHLLKKVMQTHFSHLLGRDEYLTGIKIFICNISFLSLLAALLWPEQRAELLIAAAVMTLLACMLELYGTLELMFSVHSVCLASHGTLYALLSNAQGPAPMTFAECVAALLDCAEDRAVHLADVSAKDG